MGPETAPHSKNGRAWGPAVRKFEVYNRYLAAVGSGAGLSASEFR
jgi:hypothetical protein